MYTWRVTVSNTDGAASTETYSVMSLQDILRVLAFLFTDKSAFTSVLAFVTIQKVKEQDK